MGIYLSNNNNTNDSSLSFGDYDKSKVTNPNLVYWEQQVGKVHWGINMKGAIGKDSNIVGDLRHAVIDTGTSWGIAPKGTNIHLMPPIADFKKFGKKLLNFGSQKYNCEYGDFMMCASTSSISYNQFRDFHFKLDSDWYTLQPEDYLYILVLLYIYIYIC